VKKNLTNELTQKILLFLFREGVYARRHGVVSSVASYTDSKGDTKNRFVHGGITGGSDIFVWLPPSMGNKFWGIEIKTGKDRLRPEQVGFMLSVQKMGHLASVVKDFDDFLEQWKKVCYTVGN